MIAITLFLSSIVYCQVTTKKVKISTLVKMGKELEKCQKVIKPELLLKSQKLDSLVVSNLLYFNELKVLKKDNKLNEAKLNKLNKDLEKADNKKKSSYKNYIIVGILGFIVGSSF